MFFFNKRKELTIKIQPSKDCDSERTFDAAIDALKHFNIVSKNKEEKLKHKNEKLKCRLNLNKVIKGIEALDTFLKQDPSAQPLSDEVKAKLQAATFAFVTTGDVNKFQEELINLGLLENHRFRALVHVLIAAVIGFFAGISIATVAAPGAALVALAIGAKSAKLGASIGTPLASLLGYGSSDLFYTKPKINEVVEQLEAGTQGLYEDVGSCTVDYQTLP